MLEKIDLNEIFKCVWRNRIPQKKKNKTVWSIVFKFVLLKLLSICYA